MSAPVPPPEVRYHLFLDDLSFLLPEDTDTDAVVQRLAEALRTKSVVRVTVEEPVGNPIEVVVNPAQARVVYAAPRIKFRPPGVGAPGHK